MPCTIYGIPDAETMLAGSSNTDGSEYHFWSSVEFGVGSLRFVDVILILARPAI